MAIEYKPMEGIRPYPKEWVEKYIKNRWWWNQTLGDVFDRATLAWPYDEYLVHKGERVTYGQLRERVDRLAIALLELGLKKGDSVILQLGNNLEFVYSYYACQKIGVMPVMCLPRHGASEIDHFCNLTNAVAWFIPLKWEKVDYLPLIEAVRPKHPGLKHMIVLAQPGEQIPKGMVSFWGLIEKVDLSKYPRDYLYDFRPAPMDNIHFMPTGGTTGLPKLCCRTHNDYITNVYWAGAKGQKTTGLATFHLAFNASWWGLLGAMFWGGKIVIPESLMDMKEHMDLTAREKIDRVGGVPTQLMEFLHHPDFGKYDWSHVKNVFSGAAFVPPELVREAKAKFPHAAVGIGFGMSEGPAISVEIRSPDEPEETRYTTIGKPNCTWDEMKVLDEEGNEVPTGVEGELAARGPGVFSGYFKSEVDNRKAFTADGFFRTGDLAKRDEWGNFIIMGRAKDVINRGGEMISANEIEDLVIRHPDVEDVAVIAMPDTRLGERICAYVRPKKGKTVTLDDVAAHFDAQGAAKRLRPERVELVDEIPITQIGKPDKKLLRDMITKKLKAEGVIPQTWERRV